ncbi:hypothetical protein M409DRAFT_70141 [Zasmidium cellare ATCC 36951]|uniref:Enoyl-CoA hydratase n=1 Tax=Zasmidium cellare ATCC 36951 TaxID=1080233 RepID=A0A6A6C606_ZASCE|nr:uncharacterized protein M409DRAFT_70141 [Zasmidium cellare ATCC 36951]KAF2160816.1 hypothetical protein M409DRAFT_70141 [Zasmidium cellare ATCC 36951]
MASTNKRLEQHASPSPPDVICKTREHTPGHNVATITFSNPTKLNVASHHLLQKLIDICQDLSKDDKLRAVVFTGAPPPTASKAPAFIGGADIQELSKLSSSSQARTYILHVHNACAAIAALPVPVIARMHGFALGAGLELMSSCDLKLATKVSKFGMPEAKIGLPSVVEAALFPSLIGAGRTKRLVYLAEILSADTAEDWGLIERVVDDVPALDRAVDEWVGMIVKMGPGCMRLQKRLVKKWENSTLQEGIWAGVEALEETYADGGKEAKEYMKPLLK